MLAAASPQASNPSSSLCGGGTRVQCTSYVGFEVVLFEWSVARRFGEGSTLVWTFWLSYRLLSRCLSCIVTRFCVDSPTLRQGPSPRRPAPIMGQPELVTAEYYGSASSTSSIGVGDAAINVRARAPYRIRHRGVFIGLISTILILCLGNLAVSVFICSIVEPHSTYYDSVTMGSYSAGPKIGMV